MNPPLGGRLPYFLSFWWKVTRDRHVLRAIEYGINIPLIGTVRQVKLPHPIKMNAIETKFVDDKIASLLAEGCIVQNDGFDPSGFLSNIFLVPKKDNKEAIWLYAELFFGSS